MRNYVINGGKSLKGEVTISGSKNVVLKALIAACLTDEEVTLINVPLIGDFYVMLDLFVEIGGKVTFDGHTVRLRLEKIKSTTIPLNIGAKIKTSSMVIAPLLARKGEATIPNPGGCRIGARPIDRHIKGLEMMGAKISYYSKDGYFHSKTDGLSGVTYKFDKNTHTGTETLILAAVLAKGRTVLENAAEEAEIDELIKLLISMGAKIKRSGRTIKVDGVNKLFGTTFSIVPDSNELVTCAILSSLTGGQIVIKNADFSMVGEFLEKFKQAGGAWEKNDERVRFYFRNGIKSIDVTTKPYPGFKTDWQSPWAVLMTQADGDSEIHETVYEKRFSYVPELLKMGAHLEFFKPEVRNPKEFYNFNHEGKKNYNQGIKIHGPVKLHNAVLQISDLRAGATLIIAALIADGESVIYGVDQVERGYEAFAERLKNLGAEIKVVD